MWGHALCLCLLPLTVLPFRRDAVERAPIGPVTLRVASEPPIIGYRSLPLRQAVEHELTPYERSQQHIPLRDAVEKRLSPEPYEMASWRSASKQTGSNLVCYIEAWSVYRRPPASFSSVNIDPYSCTHIIYAFAGINEHSHEIVPKDYEYDVVKGGYRSVVGLKRVNPDLKVLLSVSGHLADVSALPRYRKIFIKSVINVINKYGFDGLDIYWETRGLETEDSKWFKETFSMFVESLANALKLRNKIFTATVALEHLNLTNYYDVPRLVKHFDMIHLKAFDFTATNHRRANHHAPLLPVAGSNPYLNVDYAVQYWLKSGVQREQLILGIPFFARTYTLLTSVKTSPGSPALDYGVESEYTQQPGFMAYYEVCLKQKDKSWEEFRDQSVSPYIVKKDQWVAYDDVVSIKSKMEYMKNQGLGGVMVWSLDLDDFRGFCGHPYPLLNAVRDYFQPVQSPIGLRVAVTTVASQCDDEGYASSPDDCSVYYRCNFNVRYTFVCPSPLRYDAALNLCNWPYLVRCPRQRENLQITPYSRKEDSKGSEYKVVCYFTNWAWYRKGDAKFFPEHIDPSLCTHIVYAFASLDPNDLVIKAFDPWADLDNSFYNRITALSGPKTKVLLALGGWTDSTGDKYSKVVSSGTNRRNLVSSIVAFLRRYKFNGLHLDWNYPVCWHSDCNKGPNSDKPNFTKLVQELKEAFSKEDPPLILAAAISGYKEIIDRSYEFKALTDAVDFLSVMTFDYHGAWEGQTGHISPLYGIDGERFPFYNTNSTMQTIAEMGADKSKLIMGVPLYGQSFTLKSPSMHNIGDPTIWPGEAGELTQQPGMMASYEVCDRLRKKKWKERTTAIGPFAYSGDQWVSFENRDSIKIKADYVKSNHFGGIMAWTIDLDDFNNVCCLGRFPLLRSINKELGRDVADAEENCNRPSPPVTPAPAELSTTQDTGIVGQTTTEHIHVYPTHPTTEHIHELTTYPQWSPATTTTTTTSTTTTTTTAPITTPWWSASTSSTTNIPWWFPTKPQRPTRPTKPPRPTRPTAHEPTTTTTTTTTTSTTTTPFTTTDTTDETTWHPKPSKPWTTTEKLPHTTVKPTPPPPGSELPTSCTTGDYYPVPGNCNAYYRCILDEFKIQYCAGGLHWNNVQMVCDWPDQAHCEMTGSLTSTTAATTTITTEGELANVWWTHPTTTRPPNWWTHHPPPTTMSTTESTSMVGAIVSEECRNGEYYSVPDSCSDFYMCVNGVLVRRECAAGLVWNSELSMCDWKYKVKCPADSEDRLMAYSLEEKNVLNSIEGCSKGQFVAHPLSCNKYLQCQWNKYDVHPCPAGLHWNQRDKICDWPRNAGCKKRTDIDVEPTHEAITSDTKKPTKKPHTTTAKTTTTTTTKKQEWESTSEWSWTTPESTTASTPEPEPYDHPLSGYFKVVCYFTNWAWYRPGTGKFLPEDTNTDLCTHILYGFAVLDYENLILKSHDSWADIDNKFYRRVAAFRRKGVKVSMALGGWNDSQGDKYSRLVNNPAARTRFIEHAVTFLKKYGFDGLDLDWEYPKCWQTNCDRGPNSDKENFGHFVKELKTAFEPHGFLLSAAVSPSKAIIDAGYDVKTMAKYLDWISVMTYDYHGQWDKKTGHVAPMYFHPDDDFYYFNANYSIHYWLKEGVPRRKLVMGLPMYGQSFTLSDPTKNTLNCPASGPGQAGEFTRAAGFLAYYEICDRVKNKGWTVVQDPEHRMGPYAYSDNQWVGFDDQPMIKRKSEWIRDNDLGGGMIWALDLDDFRNTCGDGYYILLSTIAKTLSKPPVTKPSHTKPASPKPTTTTEVSRPTEVTEGPKPSSESPKPPAEVTVETTVATISTITTTTTTPTTGTSTITDKPSFVPNKHFKVVCYFTNWAWYRQGPGKYLPSDIDPDLCTHVIYGFAVLDGDQLVIKPHDTWADYDNKFYEKVTALRKKGIKVLVAIGGWNDSAGDKYSRLVNSVHTRTKFIQYVLDFIKKHDFDGLDLDWEYPKCWQVNCKLGPASDKAAFAEFVTELRAAFKPEGLLLSAAVSPSKTVIDAAYDVKVLSDKLDWISVMTYDYHGQWDKHTGHVAPMYIHPDDDDVTFNANFSLYYWVSQGADRRKIVMGMPMYGQSFSLADNKNHGLNARTYGGGEAGDQTRARGFLAYYEICQRILQNGWEVVKDPEGRIGPYAYLRDQWVSFDDQPLIRHKSEFVLHNDLGGAMIWALDLDDFRNLCGCEKYPLLRTINRVLRNYPGPGPDCSLGTQPSQLKQIDVPSVCSQAEKHELDCEKFYACQSGLRVEQQCPPGLHFSEKKLMCDWPENVECSERKENIAEETFQNESISLPTTAEEPETVDHGYKVVCYFTNWAWYRSGYGQFSPKDVETKLCTHLVYAFAVLDSRKLTIKPHDTWTDIDNEFYMQVTSLKKDGVKVLLGLGGWNDSEGDKYSRLVNSKKSRAKFISHVIEFLKKFDFDGLDIDWEYPKCWQVNCNIGPNSDKRGFASLIKELKTAMKPHGMLLSAAVSPSKAIIESAYDIPTLARYLDWIGLMAYDYHGHWDQETGHVAPLYFNEDDKLPDFNANFSVTYWLNEGIPTNKLILGIPLYGQTFTLTDSTQNQLRAPVSGPGLPGEFTRAAGFMAYYEICHAVVEDQWNVVRSEDGSIGPTAHKGNQWVSYDDVSDIKRKMALIKDKKLGGGMAWALDLDDFNNRCGCGKYPLLMAINHELRGYPQESNNCT